MKIFYFVAEEFKCSIVAAEVFGDWWIEVNEIGEEMHIRNLWINENEDVNTCGILIPICFLDIIDISKDNEEDDGFMR